MRTDIQLEINNRVTDNSYHNFINDFNSWLGITIDYRVAEVPVMVSHKLRKTLESAAVEIICECVQPEIHKISTATLDERYSVPNENDKPLFSVVDFAICKDANGNHVPRLIELQGFPSLFGYQYALGTRYMQQFGIDNATPFLSGIDKTMYFDALRKAVFADHDPENVALVELDPEKQKTRPDFIALEKYLGLRTVNIRDIVKQGKHLLVNVEGRLIRLHRIFNRTIIDELEESDATLSFNWSDDIDIEWAGHPNWYFRISKFLLPFIKHPTAPRSFFLSEREKLPSELSDLVLKPLYSFAGKGVNVNPTWRDIESIPDDERQNWILQEKVQYDACVPTPYGANKVEIRIMLIWLDESAKPLPLISLVRMGRGTLMGARYNTAPWTGSSGCLFI